MTLIQRTPAETLELLEATCAEMGLTLAEFRAMLDASTDLCCDRPDWSSRWDLWDEARSLDWLLRGRAAKPIPRRFRDTWDRDQNEDPRIYDQPDARELAEDAEQQRQENR